MRRRLFAIMIAALLCIALLPTGAFATEGDVAQLGGITYATLDEAIDAAEDGDTILLLADAETAGLNLSKNLTIRAAEGVGKPSITFTQDGIALWGTALTFENVNLVMQGIGSTPYTEWSWMAVCASKDASLTLKASSMLMDGTGTSNAHAIYFCSNNQLNLLDGSSLTIQNYAQDALEWDGGDGGYNVNIVDSSFLSDHNRSGFTGTFYATITNACVDVINSTGNGSNGSHFIITNSTVNFNDNGAHGLSAGNLTIDDSTVNACRNGGNGIHTTGTLRICNRSQVTVNGNACSIISQWTIPGAIHAGGATSVIDNSTVTIRENRGSGIYQKSASGTLTISESARVTITNNTAEKLGYGGGIYVNGTANLASNVVLYNNHAGTAGDDIYLAPNASLSYGAVGADWSLDGLPDCNGKIHAIDGWYEDGVAGVRWLADTDVAEDLHVEEIALALTDESTGVTQPLVLTGTAALKAAHGVDPVITDPDGADDKTSYPGLDKVIVESTGETDGISVSRGDTVNFALKSTVPEDLKNYLEADAADAPSFYNFNDGLNSGLYYMAFHDTMDRGLTLQEGSIVLTIKGTVIPAAYYDVTTGTDPAGNTTLDVEFNLAAIYAAGYFTEDDFGTAAIVLSYSATVDEDIRAGAYYNTAWVEYEGGHTPEDAVEVDTFGIRVFKYDQATVTTDADGSWTATGLAGATFELRDADGTVIATGESNEDGYVVFRNGSVDANGVPIYEGLKAGTYQLVETKAPDGYIKSDAPYTLTISEGSDPAVILGARFANSNVPHTGGTGTRLFTIAGVCILAAAGVLFVLSRRKRSAN